MKMVTLITTANEVLGRMFPSKADLHFALFSDEALYMEQTQRCAFWSQDNFHGVNLSSLRHQAFEEIFHQPVVVSHQIFALEFFQDSGMDRSGWDRGGT